jgi:hypothetical protein
MYQLLVLFFFFISFSASTSMQPDAPVSASVKMLFVGNSLTYVGNLPAVFDALGANNNRTIQSDMLVEGGATLTERVADQSVERALSAKAYDFVIFQERGGDIICGFGPESCENADIAMTELSKIAIKNNAKPVLLGTYQKPPHISEALVSEELKMANRHSVIHISVSDKLQQALQIQPDANWFYIDKGHPGHDLILLEAMLIYNQLFAEQVNVNEFTVDAPMYKPNAKFSGPSPISIGIVSEDIPHFYTYTKIQIDKVRSIIVNE